MIGFGWTHRGDKRPIWQAASNVSKLVLTRPGARAIGGWRSGGGWPSGGGPHGYCSHTASRTADESARGYSLQVPARPVDVGPRQPPGSDAGTRIRLTEVDLSRIVPDWERSATFPEPFPIRRRRRVIEFRSLPR